MSSAPPPMLSRKTSSVRVAMSKRSTSTILDLDPLREILVQSAIELKEAEKALERKRHALRASSALLERHYSVPVLAEGRSAPAVLGETDLEDLRAAIAKSDRVLLDRLSMHCDVSVRNSIAVGRPSLAARDSWDSWSSEKSLGSWDSESSLVEGSNYRLSESSRDSSSASAAVQRQGTGPRSSRRASATSPARTLTPKGRAREPALPEDPLLEESWSAGAASTAAAPPKAPPEKHAHMGRLHAVCEELIATEQRYHRDLSLLVHTFVQGLRREAPSLIKGLVANAEQLLQLHTALSSRFSELIQLHTGAALADAIGSELLAVSPYFVMYVSYCANFMSGSQLLQQASATNPALARVVAETEAQMTRRNIVECGNTAPVTIFSFLIKPVQRLCQYPLLFREVLKAMPPDPNAHAGPEPPTAREARAEGKRVRPAGGAAGPSPSGAHAKATYVLAVLEEVAQDVNEKVRQEEDAVRLLDELLTSSGTLPGGESLATVLGPAASLLHEVKVKIVEPAKRNKARRIFGSLAGAPKAPLAGKLFLFRDRILITSTSNSSAAAASTFKTLACWGLDEATAQFHLSSTHAGSPSTTLLISRYEESIECSCPPSEAQATLRLIYQLQGELDALHKRRGNDEPAPPRKRTLLPGLQRRTVDERKPTLVGAPPLVEAPPARVEGAPPSSAGGPSKLKPRSVKGSVYSAAV